MPEQFDFTPNYIKYAKVPAKAGKPDVHDGDSLPLHMDLGHGLWLLEKGLYRLARIAAPELSEPGGIEAREHLKLLISKYQLLLRPEDAGIFRLSVQTVTKQGRDDYRPVEKKERYGRYLVNLYGKDADDEWVDINQLMMDDGHAKPYEE